MTFPNPSNVLIIGGGVIGLAIARELHKNGVRRITLVEKGVCGEESSWAAGGMLGPQAEADGTASVTCNSVSNNQCVNWTITPNTAGPNATVADLFYFGKRGPVFIGQYYNTFRINASNP